jgi:signal recognition particle subunit SRP54
MLGMIDSMTPAERRNPKIIDMQRRNRISKGAGVQPQAISGLIKQFSIMAPMMQMAAGTGVKDRMQLMEQMKQSMMNDPSMGGLKTKGSTGKKLSPKERERLQKEREKKLRQMKRKK